MKARCIYFARPKGLKASPIKIGCSADPDVRADELSRWSPWPIELIGVVPGTFDDEIFLHSCFADLHSHSEWFRYREDLAQAIVKIIKGNSVDAVRSELKPLGPIRWRKAGIPTGAKLYHTYAKRVHDARLKLMKDPERTNWREPPDVTALMDRWKGSPYRCALGKKPSPAEFRRLEEYLSDPATHSVDPSIELGVAA